MVRIAAREDAQQLFLLNEAFNNPGETTLVHIRESLADNPQELVVVDEEEGILTGFVCVQLKKSFCYDALMPEITEVYVRPEYRKRGIASRMIAFAEEVCRKQYSLKSFELLTGQRNIVAQALYCSLGYAPDGQVHFTKEYEM